MGRKFIVEEIVEKSSSKGGCLVIFLILFALFCGGKCTENKHDKFKEDPEVIATLNTYISEIEGTSEDESRLRECLKQILSSGDIDAEYRTKYGRHAPALYYACATGNYELVKWLVEHGANVHWSYNNLTILMGANRVEGTDGEKIREYLKSKAVK